MRAVLMLVLVLGCSDTETDTAPTAGPAPEASSPAAATAAPAPSAELPELALLRSGPPTTEGPFGAVLGLVTDELGLGRMRCPLAGGGKARLHYGTPRDQVPLAGPMLLLEVDPATDPPWDLLFDKVVAEDQWITAPVTPGATRTLYATRNRVLEAEHPPAEAGKVTLCTSVRELPPRIVRGRVDLEDTKEVAVALPCAVDSKPIARDGTFIQEIRVPCTMWVETQNRQSAKLQVPAGDSAFDATFVLGPPDRLQNPDASFTLEGRKVVEGHVARLREQSAATTALVDRLGKQVAADPAKVKVVDLWKYDLWEWNNKVTAAELGLLRPSTEKAK